MSILSLTTMKLSTPVFNERAHLVIACDLDGALCLLHLTGSGEIVAEFRYRGHKSELD